MTALEGILPLSLAAAAQLQTNLSMHEILHVSSLASPQCHGRTFELGKN